MDNDITVILNIQEYIKISLYYGQIGNIAEEPNAQIILALQLLFTKLYISENQTEELQQLKEAINKDEREECKEALELAETLQKSYIAGETDLQTLMTEAKKIIKQKTRKKKKAKKKTIKN